LAGIIANAAEIRPLAAALAQTYSSVLVLFDGQEEQLFFTLPAAAGHEAGNLFFMPLPTNASCDTPSYDPFAALNELLERKSLRGEDGPIKGAGPAPAVPGAAAQHPDNALRTATARIGDWDEFHKRTAEILATDDAPAMAPPPELKELVEEYLKAGIHDFLFVRRGGNANSKAGGAVRVRFPTPTLYFPLRTAVPLDSDGVLDIFMAIPGSIGLAGDKRDIQALWTASRPGRWNLKISSSAKMYPDEIAALRGDGEPQTKAADRYYLQHMRWTGRGPWVGDLRLNAAELAPCAYIPAAFDFPDPPMPAELYSAGELQDYQSARAAQNDHPNWAIPAPALSLEIPGHPDLRADCLTAALRALELEMGNYARKIAAAREGPGDPARRDLLQHRLAELRREFLALRELRIGRYPLPEKQVLRIKTGNGVRENGLLDAEGTSRSGPFYHVAGIRGGNYSSLAPNRGYELTVFLVRPRDYPFADFYVFIADWKPL